MEDRCPHQPLTKAMKNNLSYIKNDIFGTNLLLSLSGLDVLLGNLQYDALCALPQLCAPLHILPRAGPSWTLHAQWLMIKWLKNSTITLCYIVVSSNIGVISHRCLNQIQISRKKRRNYLNKIPYKLIHQLGYFCHIKPHPSPSPGFIPFTLHFVGLHAPADYWTYPFI